MPENDSGSRPNDLHNLLLALGRSERGQLGRQATRVRSCGNGRGPAGRSANGQSPQKRGHRPSRAGQPAQVEPGGDGQRHPQRGSGLEQGQTLLRRQRLNTTATQTGQTRALQV
ncbi:hypothetical protein ABZ770_44700, partial [Streptomyces sp. NPDC006654]|uniref:hypothetical protein n=1 Tax=Streptomyces sp. NPDC006654 TaxID=3156897 RepID=UPI0033F51EBA